MGNATPPDGIPEAVRQFIFAYVDSIELLDVLTLLWKEPQRDWQVSEIDQKLRTTLASVSNRLCCLKTLHLVVEIEGDPNLYRYAPHTPALRALIDDLMAVYKIRPHRVYSLIFSPLKRARNFADAFRLFGSDTCEEKDG